MLPFLGFGYRHAIYSVALRRDSYGKSLLMSLNRNIAPIFKEAKNLKSLYVDSECETPNFKCIKHARGLENLSLKIHTRQILAHPRIFKSLNSLQKVELFLRWSNHNDDERSIIIDKFFGFLLNLPKLQHVNIWLEEGGDYYKSLLFTIYTRKLPSFHIIVTNTSDLPKSFMNWGKNIDKLILCPLYPLGSTIYPRNGWRPIRKPEKRLRLQHGSNIDDLIDKNTTIKSLEIENLSSYQSPDYFQKILTLISQTAQQLEKLLLSLEMASSNQSDFIAALNDKLSQMESFENLQTFSFCLKKMYDGHLLLKKYNEETPEISPPTTKILPPFRSKMKNLRTLSLFLEGPYFDLSDFTEALKDLASLENLYFHLIYFYENRNEKVECRLPFEWLKNLRFIYMYCSNSFLESSIDRFVESISELKNLKSLEMRGNILVDLEKEKIDVLVKDLCGNQGLEIVTLEWRRCHTFGWKKIHGEWTINPDYLPVK